MSTGNDHVTIRVRVGGEGPPLVYLHAAGGLVWDPFLDKLAAHYTTHAPEFPGTTPGPNLFSKLVLLDPIGLWRDDASPATSPRPSRWTPPTPPSPPS